jgi:flagellar M-ring protein FliF
VAGSVENLKPENVTIVDSAGRLLSTPKQDGVTAGANTFLEYKERVESGLANKVEAMLSTVLGHGRASVRVSAVLDMKSETLMTEKYDPQKVATKEEITSKSKAQPGQQGTADKAAASAGNNEKEETTTTEYMVSKTVTQTTDSPGKIVSMSVSAVVDLYQEAPAKKEGEAASAAAATGELIMSAEQVKTLIKNALGLKEGLDTIEVVNTKFYRPAEVEPQKATNWPKYMAMAKQASLGVMAVCALLVLKMFGGAKGGAGAGQLPAGSDGAQQMMAGGGQQMLPAPGMMREQIVAALQQNPDHVRRMFTNWVQEKQE